jgi:hypothetical protein
MPAHGRKKASEPKVAKTKKSPKTSPAKAGKPAEPGKAAGPASAADGVSPVKRPAARGKAKSQPDSPRVVHRDGEAFVQGCNVPIWRLEMARRAGSGPPALIAASPGLTPEALDLAFAYARRHKKEFDPLIQMHSGADVPPEDEGDEEDEETFEAELDAMFTEYAQVFRRLAQ